MVRRNYAQEKLDAQLSYVAFAIVLGGNKERPATSIYATLCENFPRRLKYLNAHSLSRILSSDENVDIFNTKRQAKELVNHSASRPRFYDELIRATESATAAPLERCGKPYRVNTSVMFLYQRQTRHHMPPTMTGVFRQARDSLASTGKR